MASGPQIEDSREVALPQPNRWERLVARVAPERAARIYRARAMMALAGAWVGARSDRRSMRNWFADRGSADATSVFDLPELRGRSRDLARNSGIAASALDTPVTHIAGTRLRAYPRPDVETLRALGIQVTDEAAKEWAMAARRLFEHQEAHIDAERKHHGADLDDVVLRSIFESGDCLVVRRWIERPESAYGTRIQVVEADRVATPLGLAPAIGAVLGPRLVTPAVSAFSTMFDPQLAVVVDGVERDLSDGSPVAYWVFNGHPGDAGMAVGLGDPDRWSRVPAWNEQLGQRAALLPFIPKRPGQTRGWPLLAPVIEEIKQTQNYIDSELLAATIASFFTVFIKSMGATGLANQAGVEGTSAAGSRTLDDEVALGSGAVVSLNKNEEIEVANPTRPNTGFGDFLQSMTAFIGAATGTPREVLTKTFTASYSASRGSLLEMWRGVRTRREWFFREYKTPTYEWVLTEAVARGDLESPGFFDDPVARDAWTRVAWIGDPMGQIDPAKESKAAAERLSMGIGTRTQTTVELTGGDFESDARRRAEENELMEELGLSDGGEPGSGANENEPPSREEIDDE